MTSWFFNTGRPYTYYPSKDGFTPMDSLAEFLPNNARMPNYSLLNIKIAKKILLGSTVNSQSVMTVYLDIRNGLNDRNVLWMDSSGKPGGELSDITAWDCYRRVRCGVRIEL